ncbi:unnamed protein product [Discula destructiva]
MFHNSLDRIFAPHETDDTPSDDQRAWECSSSPSLPQCSSGLYLYRLDENANMAFLVAASLLTLHLIITCIGHRRVCYYSAALFCGLMSQILGYTARCQSHNNQLDRDKFYMQVACLTIGPAFVTAAIYWSSQNVVKFLGKRHSLIGPEYYMIFIPCDLVSLILQATGGGLAARAHRHGTSMATGTNIMIAGLAFQSATMLCFSILGGIFAWRVYVDHKTRVEGKQAPNKNIVRMREHGPTQAFLCSLAISTLLILGRSCYRVAELSGGWTGARMANQHSFIIFEGVFVFFASLLLTVFHPACAARDVLHYADEESDHAQRQTANVSFYNIAQDVEKGQTDNGTSNNLDEAGKM